MNTRETYQPGPANLATVQKDGDNWTLVLTKELRHAPETVWQALTDPAELRQWAPFDADKNLATQGETVKLTTVGAPQEHVVETKITRADPPKTLEYNWAGGPMRWELEPNGQGTKLTLWANIDKRYIAMGAAGWHLCLDVLEHLLNQQPIGRIVAGDALKFDGWQRLHKEYAQQFGAEMPSW